MSAHENTVISSSEVLPWLLYNERQSEFTDVAPGEYVLRTLFSEFTILTDRKLEHVLAESLEKPLSKSLQRGEDPQFDQLLRSLNAVAKYSLSSLLKTFFQWYSMQQEKSPDTEATDGPKNKNGNKNKGASPDSPKLSTKVSGKEVEYLLERRDHAIDFLLCLVLIEVLKQLPQHPVDDSLTSHIENLAFKCFKQRSSFGDSPSATNAYIIAALYAEVIGVLAQTRFQSVRKRFLAEFKENAGNSEMLVNVICGMKYLRIKLFPVEHVEETFMFLQDCANVFIDTRDKDKDVKYALAGVFVEILVPVAATAKRELHIPALKNFIDLLYPYAFDMSKKNKHLHAMYPLVAVLMCVSQKQFFLTHWPFLLNACLTNIKHRDTKLQRICLECLYRMLWVYVIRIKGENNSTTLSRLRSVTDTLFPRGSRVVNPRDVPITIFVKIVHFISHYNIDFAMQDIIFDLLSVGRFRQIHPERMNIGLRSFLVIVDSLQKKDGDPPMPNTTGTLPSGSSLRVKKSFLNKPLTEEAAKDLGISKYFHSVCKALNNILHNLDSQVGRPLMKNNPQCSNKDPYDMITGERKPKIDLFRTSVASIPKLIPHGMSKSDIVRLLSRLTIHVDEELRSLAFSSLQSLILDFVEWREDVIIGFVNFIMREVQDHHATLLDGLLRMILKMLAQWKTLMTMSESERKGTFQQTDITIPMSAIHCIEGCGLAMLCSIRQIPRKLALMLLKEARVLGNLVAKNGSEIYVMDVIDEVSSGILTNVLKNASPEEKSLFGSSNNMDLQWFVDRLPSGFDTETGECGDARHNDLWCSVISQLLLKKYIPDACPVATQFSWQAVHHRLFTVYSVIDPSPSGMDSLTSLSSFSNSRSTKKVYTLSDIYLWQNYLMFACTVHPVSVIDHLSCETDNGNSSDEGRNSSDPRPSTPDRVECLFRFAIALIRNESSEIRNAVITCLGRVSPVSYKEFVDELQVSLLQYVLEKRAENQRKRKKRDNVRTYLARIFELNAEHGCFRESPNVLSEEGALSPTFVDYIENTRLYFCSGDADRDPSAVHQLKLNFAGFIYKMIKSIPHSTLCSGQLLTKELRGNLFFLFSSWCSKTVTSAPVDKMSLLPPGKRCELDVAAIQALCAVLCCGPVFDKCGLANGGYFYQWIENVLCSPDKIINCIGQETVELLLDSNDDAPSLLEWVINKCYTGSKVISNKCFQALTTVLIRRPYPCEAIPVISLVLFKTSSAYPEEREKAAQLLQLLERRFLSYCEPGLSKYSQSPMELSFSLASSHPELTIPLLAELTYRFETAPFVYQRIILKYMLPWLRNVQLVDMTSNRNMVNTRESLEEELVKDTNDTASSLPHVEMTGDGWGSRKATQLVLNNLFFLTVKYGEDFNTEFEELWSALSNAWIGNNHEILNYLNILAGITSHPEFFTHAKRLVIYLVRANKEGTIQTLMDELQLTEPVAPQFERCEQPPYYTFIYKDHSTSLLADDSNEGNTNESEIMKDIDLINSKAAGNLERISNITPAVRSGKEADNKSISNLNEENLKTVCEDLDWAKAWVSCVHNRQYVTSGLPLPLSQSELRFAALIDVLPLPQVATPLYRCNFSLILLSEVIRDQPRVNWLPHLPLILHVVFLGFDHNKALIHEHCKSLLVNLAVILVLQGDYSSVAPSLMKFQYFSYCSAGSRYYEASSVSRDGRLLSLPEKEAPNERDQTKLEDEVDENNADWTEKVKRLVWYLTQSEGKPLWSFEDITTKCHNIQSASELTEFLVRVLDIFDGKFQEQDIRGCWARVASKWAISCSSRHYAGRSFQVLRGLAVQLSWSVLSDILSRLAESIGDSNEDVQGYVMEILLTLDSVIEQSRENRAKSKVVILSIGDEDFNDGEDSGQQILGTSSPERSIRSLSNKTSCGHIRSLSSGCDLRGRFSQFEELSPKMRSVSLQSLRLTKDNGTTLSQTDLLSRIFWVAVSLLESDYEHEFGMAVKLLSKVLNLIELSQKSTLERLESLLYKLNWSQFSGVQMLLLKGLTSAATSASTIELIKNTTPYSNISIMDVSEYSGAALNILALLPYMIQRFNEPDEFCLSCAATLGQVCVNNNMLGFGKLFAMYCQRIYHKTVQMWTEGVCRYIYEFYRQSIRTLLAFLTEMLERGPQLNQTAVLNITCALMRHVDFKLSSSRHILIPTLKVISKHIKDDLWIESLNVLILAVSSCAQLEIPVVRPSSVMFDSTWSLVDQSVSARQDLPGKTLDFTFDVTATLDKSFQDSQDVFQKGLSEASGWKRPQLSQRRTKERLVSVLHVCGHHIGLKQSPSVVFSSSSDLMVDNKQAGSDHSSSDENQYLEGDSKQQKQANETQQLIGVFTGFDFLDDEIDEHEDDISGFGWDLPTGEYTTPEPSDSRLRHSPLSGSEPDITSTFRLDTSDEEDDITQSLSNTVSPSIAMPLTEEALRAHDLSKGFSVNADFTPPSESSQESAEFLASPRLPRFVTSVLDTRHVDEQWTLHVTALVSDTSGSTAVDTFALLALLLRQMRRRVNEVTRQCCNVLDNSLFGVTSLFIEILEALDVQGHCPHVYMDSETVRRSKILERQKFMVLEIDDHYRSYKEMYHNAGRALERLRNVTKPQGEYPSSQDTLSAEESKYEECEIALCWALYKLHFQVLLFLDSYSRLFEHLLKQASKADIANLTNKVGLVRNEIISALSSVKQSSAEPSLEQAVVDSNDTYTFASVTESILRNLYTNNTEFAIRTLYVFRDKLHSDGHQYDVEFLTKLYARFLVEKKPGALAMTKSEFALPSVISELKEMTIHILAVIEQLSPADKT